MRGGCVVGGDAVDDRAARGSWCHDTFPLDERVTKIRSEQVRDNPGDLPDLVALTGDEGGSIPQPPPRGTPMNTRLVRFVRIVVLAVVALTMIGFGTSTATAAAVPPDKTYTWSGTYRTPDGKAEDGSATFTSRPTSLVNPVEMKTHLHVSNPYWFVGARGSITATVYAHTIYGDVAVWSVRHDLTACAKTDPSCSSAPTGDWTDHPDLADVKKIQKGASYMVTTLTLN